MADEKEYKYAVIDIDEVTMNLAGDTIKSNGKVLTLNQAQNDDLNNLLKKGRPDISRHLQLIDMAKAEKIAKEDMAKRAHATQGMHNSGNANNAHGKDLAGLGKVIEIPPPPGTPVTALDRLRARSGPGNAAQLDTTQAPSSVLSPEDKAKEVLANAIESDTFHPEDNDAAAKALLLAGNKTSN